MSDVFDYYEDRKEELAIAVDHIVQAYYPSVRKLAVETILQNGWDDATEREIQIATSAAIAAMFKGFQDQYGEFRIIGTEPDSEDDRLFGSYNTEEENTPEETDNKEQNKQTGHTRKIWKKRPPSDEQS